MGMELKPTATVGSINYSFRTEEQPVILSDGPGCHEIHRGYSIDPHDVPILNGRLIVDQLSLDRYGFLFLQHSSRVTEFDLPSQVRDIYFAESANIVQRYSRASRVVAFDPTLRKSNLEAGVGDPLRAAPFLKMHGDFTHKSAAQTLRDLLPNECEVLLSRRFSIFQIWRPILHPVEGFPLAVADASSVADSDLFTIERIYPDWTGESTLLSYSPCHRWYWFPRMTPDEIILFKSFDSDSSGIARWVPHGAFVPRSPSQMTGDRSSIEVRVMAFY